MEAGPVYRSYKYENIYLIVIRIGFGFRIVLSPSLGQRGMQCPMANSHLGGGGDRNFALLKDFMCELWSCSG